MTEKAKDGGCPLAGDSRPFDPFRGVSMILHRDQHFSAYFKNLQNISCISKNKML